jgi:2-C-methyl-D-erythritol 4-phosphate cytidylyltransferase
MTKKKCVAVILASGVGSRAGFSRPKQLIKLAGKPVVAHTLHRFEEHDGIDEIAIVTNDACRDEIEGIVLKERLTKVKKILLGGEERYQSSISALRAYEEEANKGDLNLLFHDAVRPMVSQKIITDVIAALDHYPAIDTAIRATDTVIVAEPSTDLITSIPDRAYYRLGQTPQGFHHSVLKSAYERALADPNFKTTDDCGVVVKYAPEVRTYVVDGSTMNIKLTYQEDLIVLDKFMQSSEAKRMEAASQGLQLSKLAGQNIVIFGGTSGIGESMTTLARAYGATVHAVSRATGADITDAAAVQAALKKAAEGGKINAVVNAAAILDKQPLASMSFEDLRRSLEINILGAANVAKASYEYLEASRGCLMFFASSSYTYGRAFYSAYSSSKAAVVNLTQALADEWLDAGIRVNCVNPERARTPMRTKAFGVEPEDTLLDPEDVARKSLGLLTTNQTGYVYDIVKA